MVTLRHTPPGPPDPDDDPTGMRELLSSLPDPGPMPDDLVARITASLATEQGARSRAHPLHPLHHRASRHRSLWRTAGLAAAAVAVIGLGAGSMLTDTAPGDLGALFGGSSNDSAASGAAAVSRENAGSAGAQGDAKAQSAVPAVSIHHSDTAYTSAHLGDQARVLLASAGDPVPPLGAESPAVGPIATVVGLRSCLSALTSEPYAAVTADLGRFDGRPAAVLVLTTDTGHTAYAVQRSCSTGHPALLAGPVALP